MPCLSIVLDISPRDYRRYYSGQASVVMARSRDGRRVRFPAHVLRSHLTHDGIRGVFLLHFDESNRFIRLEREMQDPEGGFSPGR